MADEDARCAARDRGAALREASGRLAAHAATWRELSPGSRAGDDPWPVLSCIGSAVGMDIRSCGASALLERMSDLMAAPTCRDVRGERDGSDRFECSECGRSMGTWDVEAGTWAVVAFCPSCGAEVRPDA